MNSSMPIYVTTHEINQFLERCKLSKLTQEETNNLNMPMTIKDIRSIMSLQKQKAPA